MPQQVEPSDTPAPRNVLVADADPDVRAALGLLLRRQRGVSLVGQAADVGALLALAASTHVDLVLLDWDADGFRDAQALARLRELCPTAAVLALGVRPEHRHDALASGAHIFVSKADSPSRVLAAIGAALNAVARP
jgi:DNA-binding NarL/FixJ family response regulator